MIKSVILTTTVTTHDATVRLEPVAWPSITELTTLLMQFEPTLRIVGRKSNIIDHNADDVQLFLALCIRTLEN